MFFVMRHFCVTDAVFDTWVPNSEVVTVAEYIIVVVVELIFLEAHGTERMLLLYSCMSSSSIVWSIR